MRASRREPGWSIVAMRRMIVGAEADRLARSKEYPPRWHQSEGKSGASAYERSIDDVDRRLVAELQGDARLTIAELGRRVGLSAPAVADRLRRLERDGVITGYRADVDPRALGTR